jgi:NAD(P)-dependent dehydrogenase (short-subunit alcohol dehydrogenase family)
LNALIQSLTIEWSPAIRVVGVAPGFITTELTEKYFESFTEPAREREKAIKKFPLKRFGTPEEIGGWFVFLSSGYANFAGGQVYLIDGGNAALMINE